MKNLLETKRVEGERDYQTAKSDSGATIINAHMTLTTGETLLVELFQTQLRDVAGLSAITAWGFTGSDLVIESDIHAFDFAGMNTSRVVSAGSGSRPGVDGLAPDLNAHRVSGLNGFHSVPTNSDLLQGISNTDSLIEDLYLGMNEEQIGTAENKACPCNGYEVGLKSSGRNRLNDKSKNNECSNASGEPDRARAIKKDITSRTHRAIFSQQPGLEGSQS